MLELLLSLTLLKRDSNTSVLLVLESLFDKLEEHLRTVASQLTLEGNSTVAFKTILSR